MPLTGAFLFSFHLFGAATLPEKTVKT